MGGHGHGQEGKARAEEESYACRRHSPAQSLPQEERSVHLFRRQRGCDCQRQGRDEGLGHHWPCREGMRRLVAKDRVQRVVDCVSTCCSPFKTSTWCCSNSNKQNKKL